MKPHFNRTEMIEVYYLPDEFPMAQSHFENCSDCAGNWSVVCGMLSAGSIDDQALVDARPDTFWTWQRLAIQRKIGSRPRAREMRWWSLPAVAAMAIVVSLIAGSSQIYRIYTPTAPSENPEALPTASSVIATTGPNHDQIFPDMQTVDDPWSSEQFESYKTVVAWETWIDESEPSNGGAS